MAILASLPETELDLWLLGRRLPAFTSHTMADAEQLRSALVNYQRQGWALSEQQLELNYRGVAVPLLDRYNTVHGAISITMPINREDTDHALMRVLPVMQEVTRSLRPLL